MRKLCSIIFVVLLSFEDFRNTLTYYIIKTFFGAAYPFLLFCIKKRCKKCLNL